MGTDAIHSAVEAVAINIAKVGVRIVNENQPSTIYDEIVKIRQAVENKVVVSSQ